MALFPNLAPSCLDPAWSFIIYGASSSASTLALMRNIALCERRPVLAGIPD